MIKWPNIVVMINRQADQSTEVGFKVAVGLVSPLSTPRCCVFKPQTQLSFYIALYC